MKCKICGKSLYENVTFFNLFNPKYLMHDKCKRKLQINSEEIYLPFESSFIVFKGIISYSGVHDKDFLFSKYAGICIDRHMKQGEWSILLIYEQTLNYETLKLVHYLADNHLFILSLNHNKFYELEDLLVKKI